MNIKYSILPAIIVADLVTKLSPHYDVSNHRKEMHWYFLLALLPLAYISVRQRLYLLPAMIMITGGLCNYWDSQDGVVINPFIIIVLRNAAGFNVADLAILTGFVWCVILAIKERKHKKAAKKIGSVEWKNA